MIKQDKLLHLLGGSLIAAVFSLINPIFGNIAIIAGYFKEYYDKRHPGIYTYDGWDAFATAAGTPIGQLLVCLLVNFNLWKYVLPF